MAESTVTNPIPDFDSNGNLPPGLYVASLAEIKMKLTWSAKRKKLFKGLSRAVGNLKKSGVSKIFIDGSFTTNKEEPNDIDGCWIPNHGIDMSVLDPVFIDRHPPREKMKQKYGVDFLIAGVDTGDNNQPIHKFFQENRDGQPKGIILLNI